MHLHYFHLLHNLHAMQENIHMRNKEKNGGPLPRTPTTQVRPKPVARHFNLPNHSHHNMTICRLYLHHGKKKEAEKVSKKNLFFNWVHSLPTELMNASHSTILFTISWDHISSNGKAPLHSHINARNVSFLNLSR